MWRDSQTYKSFLIIVFMLILGAFSMHAQSKETTSALPFHSLSLQDLKGFERSKGKQWTIAGDVFMNRHEKLHSQTLPGKGILVSGSSNDKQQKLTTLLQHGDIDLDVDFMLSSGSSASLLLQGRYEILLSDSWNTGNSAAKNCGSIMGANKDNDRLPEVNACKAPGLWQRLSIRFKAPTFDEKGNKVNSARFTEVKLNGELIHKELSIDQPSYSSALKDEKKTGGLTIINGKGSVAFRNLQYKTYDDSKKIKLANIEFDVYKGLFKKYDTLKNFTPLRTGHSDSLSWRSGDRKSQLVLRGTMEIPRDGEYLFELKAGGAAWLLIDNEELLYNNGTRDYTRSFFGKKKLTVGPHQFKIAYANSDESLVLKYEGPEIPMTALTTKASERKIHESEPLELRVNEQPVYQRGFMMHKGDVNPYILSVGLPGEVNFAYDMTTYNLLSTWKGRYIDVSNMWTERGESQKEVPLGPLVEFEKGLSIAHLNQPSDPWQDSVAVDNSPLSERGYKMNNNGIPVFQYRFGKVKLEDSIAQSGNKAGLTRSVKVEMESSENNTYFLIARGKTIERLPNGDYAINDKQYYIESLKGVDENQLLIVKSKSGHSQLLLPLKSEGKSFLFNYTIVW